MWDALKAEPKAAPLLRLFHMAYSSPSALHVFEGDDNVMSLWSVVGARQGCPLSSFSFDLSMQKVFNQIKSDTPAGVPDRLSAIHDDTTILASTTHAFAQYDKLNQLLTPTGSVLNPSKCLVFWPHPTPAPTWLRQAAASRHLTVQQGGSVKPLGAYVGLDTASLKQRLMAHTATHEPLFAALESDLLHPQIAMLLLRYCAVPTMHHLARSTAPSVLVDAALAFDARVLQTTSRILALPPPSQLPSDVVTLGGLPIRAGGMGIRPLSRVLEPAFIGGVSQAASVLAPIVDAVRPPGAPPLPTVTALIEAFNHLTHQRVLPDEHHVIPGTALDLLNQHRINPPRHVQKYLTAKLEIVLLRNLMSTSSTMSKARLLSLSNPGSARYLTVIPESPELLMPRAYFRHAAHFHLDIAAAAPNTALPSHCPLCSEPLLGSWHHFSACTAFLRRAVLRRHDNIKFALAQICHALLLPYEVEPRLPNTHLVPDLAVTANGRVFHLDISVTNPSCPSFRVAASTSRLAAAGQREQFKLSKYSEAASSNNATFVPFVFEAYGTMGERAKGFLKMICEAAPQACNMDPDNFRSDACNRLSIALHRGNGAIVASAISTIAEAQALVARRARRGV